METIYGTHGFEPRAYRTAADCSTTELFPPLRHPGIEPRSKNGNLHDTTTPMALISETIRFICHKLYARLD